MAVTASETNDGKVLEIKASGKLTREDYEHFIPKFDESIRRHGKIRILFEMVDFHGWEAGALWDDLKLDLKHFADIERLAMVGDTAWEKGMSTFCQPFTTAKVRYFDEAALAEARAWVTGE